MVERLSPLAFNRIVVLDKWVRLMETTGALDPYGGLVPGPPKIVAQMFAAVEPAQLSRLQKEALKGGAVSNAESYHVTFWYQPGVSVSQYIEFDDVDYPPAADGAPQPVTTRTLDILEVRQVQQQYRYLELLCKERVPPPPPTVPPAPPASTWAQPGWTQPGWMQ